MGRAPPALRLLRSLSCCSFSSLLPLLRCSLSPLHCCAVLSAHSIAALFTQPISLLGCSLSLHNCCADHLEHAIAVLFTQTSPSLCCSLSPYHCCALPAAPLRQHHLHAFVHMVARVCARAAGQHVPPHWRALWTQRERDPCGLGLPFEPCVHAEPGQSHQGGARGVPGRVCQREGCAAALLCPPTRSWRPPAKESASHAGTLT